VLGAKRQFGDTWKMLKWQFSGSLGGNRDKASRAGRGGGGQGLGGGHTTPMPPPPSHEELVSSDGRLRVL
jgi:hypothetical protein